MDSLPQEEIDYQLAHINDNQSVVIIGVCSAFVGLAIVVFSTRLLARKINGTPLGWDDYLAIASILPLIELNISTCLSAAFGTGRHQVWVLKYGDLVKLGKVELGISVGYIFTMVFAKLSVLALYARVFTLSKRYMRWGIYFVGTITILWFISVTLSVFLPCKPLSSIWGVPTQCLPPDSISLTFAAVNLSTDIIVLILPQPAIWSLQLSSVSKLNISIIFLLGLIATAITFARTVLLGHSPNHNSPYDSTYNTTVTIIFTVLEPAFLVLCGSLPMVPGLFKFMKFPVLKSNKLVYLKTSSQGYLRWKTSRDGDEGPNRTGSHDQQPPGSRDAWNKTNTGEFESTEIFDLDARESNYRVQTHPWEAHTPRGYQV
ncbi:hypothetical protein F5Y00DRAFT_268246 [Daldinia vernicosa]|uniref:uncharacterized protein n=1 Tax=Daldinia vernicosa TaxID=114800 RepID=UPI002008B9F1|nr:uncharacterized protein F5Y00DRAFT_268246 [Daldinia vernicosa]KAI0850468.1 hypothetical protein F5Y00DRAFT_268246 [Daldinia vernicosa]